jgi:hypothetical protein
VDEMRPQLVSLLALIHIVWFLVVFLLRFVCQLLSVPLP